MTDMREYAAQHGWEVGSHLRYAGSTQPPSVITYISATEIRISTPGDFPGRLTGGSSSGLEKWALDWQYRAERAEAAITRVRQVLERYRTSPYREMSQTDALGAVGRALEGDKLTRLTEDAGLYEDGAT